MAYHTSFLSSQHDVIASFSFGVCTVKMDFCEIKFLVDICENIANLSFSVVSMDNCQYFAQYVLTWSEARKMWPYYFLCQV